MAGHIINECPASLLSPSDRNLLSHSIIINSELTIPLRLHGVISYFHTRRPHPEELSDPDQYPRIQMTSDTITWDPSSNMFNEDEDAIRTQSDPSYTPHAFATLSACLSSISTVFDYNNFVSTITQRYVNAQSSRRKGIVTPNVLAQRWNITLEQAQHTIDHTTQLAVRDLEHATLTRRLKPNAYQLKYRRLRTVMYTDTIFGPVPSYGMKYTCMQIYCTDFDWIALYPLKSKKDAHTTLQQLFSDYGIPHTLIADNAAELIGPHTEFRKQALRAGITLRSIEAHTPNQNHAETVTRELRRHYKRLMRSTNAPVIFWDHCLLHIADIRRHVSLNKLEHDVPAALLTGDTPDISHLVEFGWYDRCWYYTPTQPHDSQRQLGRYLGASYDVGEAMSCKILTEKGKIVSRTSVAPLTVEHRNDPAVHKQVESYDRNLADVLQDRIAPAAPDPENDDEQPTYQPYEDDNGVEYTPPEADEHDHDAFDKLVSAEVLLKRGGKYHFGTVKQRSRDHDGRLIGKSNDNPLLATALYDIEFMDGVTEAYAANTIAEGIFAQVDDEGRRHLIFDGIIDHRKTQEAITGTQAKVNVRGKWHHRRTTKGWQLCVQWKDGTTSWEFLKDLKESNPIEVAEYAKNNNLLEEPAFIWWAPYTLNKRDRVIKAMQNRAKYIKKTHKFGIEIPHTVERAIELDTINGNTLWQDAIAKEMGAMDSKEVFKYLEKGKAAPVGYQKIPHRIIFDVKMDFTRKARLVAGGHVTEPPSSITFASVVSRDSVRLAFMLAALNDVDVLAGDVSTAYLNAKCREKVYIVCGKEFGSKEGQIAVVEKALYGLKSSGAAWRNHLARIMREELEFTSCKADPDVWFRPATKVNGEKYYEYVLVYTDDILALSVKPKEILDKLNQFCVIKSSSIMEPKTYLGADITKYQLPDDPAKTRWAISSDTYVKEALKNVKKYLADRGKQLKAKPSGALPTNYRPELDDSPYCDQESATYYMQQIGILRWAVELGRIDICCEVSMLSSYTAAPREGHLEGIFHIYAYLESHNRSKMVMDDSYPDLQPLPKPLWTDFYPDATEKIPGDAPEPRGKPVDIVAFVDADHAGDKVTRRSRTGILIFVNRAPIMWMSKKQTGIETSSFGSEFTAMKTCVEMIQGLRYKLRMMGVPIDSPARVQADNEAVVKNSSMPESTLKKKCHSIAYHFVRENAASGCIEVAYENTKTNLADMLTKQQSTFVRTPLMQRVLY